MNKFHNAIPRTPLSAANGHLRRSAHRFTMNPQLQAEIKSRKSWVLPDVKAEARAERLTDKLRMIAEARTPKHNKVTSGDDFDPGALSRPGRRARPNFYHGKGFELIRTEPRRRVPRNTPW